MMTNKIATFLNIVMKPMQSANLRFRFLNPRAALAWMLTLTLVSQMAVAPVTAAVRFDSANDSGEKKADKNKPAKPVATKQQINSTPVTSVSAASFEEMAAPDSIIAAFGSLLATTTKAATTIPLPTTIEGTSVTIRDSANVERLAPLFFVSPAQVNYAVPAETALGQATVEVRSGDGTISRGTLTVRAVAPAVFTANSNGRGVPAANLLRVRANGEQIFESLAEFDAAENRFKTKPIDLGPEGERVFLILYLTGLRRAADPNNDGNLNESFRLLVGGVQSTPLFVGALQSFVGLEQINSAEIPRSLSGRGRVNVAVAALGFSASNLCEIEIAPLQGLAPPQVTGFSPASAQAGQTITINGSGFSPNPAENLVRIGGVEASVRSANPTQLEIVVPFVAETGRVSVRTPGGEGASATALSIRASISGIVEDTQRQPLAGATVRLVGASITATTNADGTFILPDVPTGPRVIEVEAGAPQSRVSYPRLRLRVNVAANRDNQFARPIALQPVAGAELAVSAAGFDKDESINAPIFNAESAGAVPLPSGNVVFEVPAGASVQFADGAASGELTLTTMAGSRAPVALPAGQFNSVMAQITPFGATLNPGGKLSFPNPDGFAAGAQATLYTLDQTPDSPTLGSFITAGSATVSADGQRIETPAGAVTRTGIYFVSLARGTTTVIGRVVESDGATPVRRALVSAHGQEALTDGNGGFILRNVAAKANDQIAVEADAMRPTARVDRAQSGDVVVIVSGVTVVTPDVKLPPSDIPRPPVLIAPTSLNILAGQTTDIPLTVSDPDGGQTIQVTVAGAPFASIISSSGAFSLRLAPGLNTERSYTLTLTAAKNPNAMTSVPISVSVLSPPPTIANFTPKSHKVGGEVTLTGANLKSGDINPDVTFAGVDRRIPASILSATDAEVRVTVPYGAVDGPIELRTVSGRAVASPAFDLLDFELGIAPSATTALQGGRATYVVSITSPDSTFTQLAVLSVSGLPAGVTASFDPKQITAGATSTLTLVVPGNISTGSYNFTLQAEAQVAGNKVTRTAGASVTVQLVSQTTLAGHVLSTKNEPILGATVSLDGQSTTTDASGSFILSGITAGANRPVMVDGRTASAPGKTYPVIAEPVDVVAGTANVVPYTFYLPAIDVQYEVQVKPNEDTMVTTPMAPGVMMMIPANARLRMRDGTPVTRVSLTPVEIDRTPAPLPPELGASMVFTSQPGGAISDIPIPVIYPNKGGANPGTKAPLWYFNHDTVKWERYGTATVSKDGRHLVPDIDPRTGKMYGLPDFSWHPDPIPNPCQGGKCCSKCPCGQGTEPVDFSSGLKIEEMTDISIGGARGGLELTRTWTNNLAANCSNCSFGVGTTHNYGIRLSGSFEDGGAGRVIRPGEVTGELFGFVRKEGDGSLVFTPTASMVQVGDELRKLTNGSFEYKYRNGDKMRFDSAGRLTALVDRNGNTTTLSYVGNNLMSVRDAVGRALTFQYEGSRISKVTDPLNREWKYEYDRRGRLAIVTDPLEHTTKYEYDNFFRLTSVTDKRGIVVKTVIYDNAGRVKEQRFADGGFERYAYSFAGPTITGVTITNSLNRTKSMRFNGSGQVVEMVDELGQRSVIERDPIHDLPLSTTGPCGCVEDKRKYDDRGNAIEITDQLGKTAFYEYEPTFNNLIKMTDRRGNVTTYTYDTRGNRETMTNARGETTIYTYDQFGQLKTIRDGEGHTMRMEYDNFGNVKERYDGLNNRTTMEYDAIGNLKAIVDPLGRRTEMTYDLLDRLKTITDANKATTAYDYDPNGNQILMTDALERKWMRGYDTRNRLISRTDPLARISRMRYNTAGEMTAMISPSGRTTTYGYDKRGQRIEMKDPLGNFVRFTYDSQRNMTALSDQRGNTTTFSYDELDRVIARRDPLGFATTYEYDPEGNLIATVDRLRRRTTVSYDKLNRREQVTYVDDVVNYTYDRAGRLTGVADTQGGPITWAYDDANRLLSETTPQGVVRYTYNNASQRASMIAADRPPVTYGYDEAGRLKTITQSAETFTYGYDKLSRVERLERPNGVKTEYSYDEVNRLKRLTHSNAIGMALEDFQYSFNADDEIEAIQSLASATLLPTSKNVSQANAANRIAQFGQAGLSFDNEGQTTTRTDDRGTAVYEWDARGRLKKVTMPNGQTVGYGYDSLGRRINRTADGVTTNFVYDGQDVVLDRTGSSAVDYLNGFGIDNKLRQTSGGFGPLYFLRDHLGSTVALVNGAGGPIERLQYEAFGASAGGFLTRYGFTGRESDTVTGLLYYRARYYNPSIGRFLTEDPISFRGGMNFYTYVRNSPMNFVDPLGLQDSASPWQVGWEWLTGWGPREHYFTDGDPFTELLREHQHIQELIQGICSGSLTQNGSFDYTLKGLQGIPKYFRDYSTLLTGGLTGNLARTYLGSYHLKYSVTNGTLNIHVRNSSTIASATHPPWIGYMDWWSNYIGNPLNNFFSSGPMSKTTQYFDFHEDIAKRCGCK
jgi:uncharacterized protein (TIGR03437 family)